MADALVRLLLQNLSSLIQNEIGVLWGVEEDLQRLSSTLSTIQNVLQDAENRQFSDKTLANWLAKLKEAAYDADDILDECVTNESQLSDGSGIFNKKVSKFLPSLLSYNHIIFRHRVGHKIKAVIKRLDEIAAERSKFHLREGTQDRAGESGQRTPTDSFVIESEVYGRGEDKEKIVELLLTFANSRTNISVIPIVGMGGVGKTTLAQLIYNDWRIKDRFKTRIWVCVSEDFELKRLIKAILESVRQSKCHLVEMEALHKDLHETLKGKKFLLVLDDVWNEDEEKWERLKQLLTCGGKGSSIIVTTRNEKIATIMGTISKGYHLAGLSMDDCWSLFKRRAFDDKTKEEEHPNLVKIGKEIASKCGGLPLAAKTMGSLMRSKSEREWLLIKESEIWELPEDKNAILPALRLSYILLSCHLRQCFTFCSIFPKDYEMKKQELIHLWMANGLVQTRGRMELEDIGQEIFNELLWRSFFQDIKEDDYGNVIKCKMHDLMHDLAQSINGDECHSMEHEKLEKVSERTKHLYCRLDPPFSTKSLYEMRKLRTLFIEHPFRRMKLPRDLSMLKYLRVLRMNVYNTEISSSLGGLEHLRYLDFTGSCFHTLPKSVGNLRNLQTLKLRDCRDLLKLPKSISNLRNLQTLDLNGCKNFLQLPEGLANMMNLRHLEICGTALKNMPIGIRKLSRLQTLTIFIVGQEEGCQIRELKELNLGGKLAIKHLSIVPGSRDAMDANLISKQNITSLILSWRVGGRGEMRRENFEEEVLEGLQPHPNLKELTIDGYEGIKFPRWLEVSLLSNLVQVQLVDCRRCENLPPLGQLPFLTFLEIQGFHSVKYIGNELYGNCTWRGFASLETMLISDMPNWEEWMGVEGREDFPQLNKLTINGCHKLTRVPHFPSLSSLSIKGCDELTSLPEGLLKNSTLTQSSKIWKLKKWVSSGGDLDNLIPLKSLEIDTCEKLMSLPEGLKNLKSLERLEIRFCHNLKSLPEEGLRGLTALKGLSFFNCRCLSPSSRGLQFLTALEDLKIMDCASLTSLPEGMQHLTALRRLTIRNCKNLSSLPEWIQLATTLEHLNISSCPALPYLMKSMKHLSALRNLEFSDYEELSSLPYGIEHLTNLEVLEIKYCPALTSLPNGIQHLTKLSHLNLRGCKGLERRCKRNKGEDWHKIAHIPYINFP